MSAADPPPAAAPAMSPTLGELDGVLESPCEEPETPVGPDLVPVPVLVPESRESGNVELLWEVNVLEVLVMIPPGDKDEVEVELGVSEESVVGGTVVA